MPPLHVTFERLINSVLDTSMLYEQQGHEDIIDYMHRLAKSGLRAERISELSGVPHKNVEYWMHANGYSE